MVNFIMFLFGFSFQNYLSEIEKISFKYKKISTLSEIEDFLKEYGFINFINFSISAYKFKSKFKYFEAFIPSVNLYPEVKFNNNNSINISKIQNIFETNEVNTYVLRVIYNAWTIFSYDIIQLNLIKLKIEITKLKLEFLKKLQSILRENVDLYDPKEVLKIESEIIDEQFNLQNYENKIYKIQIQNPYLKIPNFIPNILDLYNNIYTPKIFNVCYDSQRLEEEFFIPSIFQFSLKNFSPSLSFSLSRAAQKLLTYSDKNKMKKLIAFKNLNYHKMILEFIKNLDIISWKSQYENQKKYLNALFNEQQLSLIQIKYAISNYFKLYENYRNQQIQYSKLYLEAFTPLLCTYLNEKMK